MRHTVAVALVIAGCSSWFAVPIWRGWRREAVTGPEVVFVFAGMLVGLGVLIDNGG